MGNSLLVKLYEGMVDDALPLDDPHASRIIASGLCATRQQGNQLFTLLKEDFPYPIYDKFLNLEYQSSEYVKYTRVLDITRCFLNREEAIQELKTIIPRISEENMSLEKVASFIYSEQIGQGEMRVE